MIISHYSSITSHLMANCRCLERMRDFLLSLAVLLAFSIKNNNCIIFHESCHVDMCACSHLLGIVDFSGENECTKKDLHISLPEKPVDSPYLLEWDSALPLDFFLFPEPDIFCCSNWKRSERMLG